MTSMRIVLVDPLGDVLFSGASSIARARGDEPAPAKAAPANESSIESRDETEIEVEIEIEPCPETMRSAGSGVYRSVDPATVRNVPVIEDVSAQIRDAEAARSSNKARERAA
jgi:hypothetical protein